MEAKFERLQSVKGIGPITALVLLIKMPELGTLNRGQCAALAGLAPYDDDSGTARGKRRIQGERSEIRGALYMAALAAAHFNPVSKVIYQQLLAAKKPFKVAITAVDAQTAHPPQCAPQNSGKRPSMTELRLIQNRPGGSCCENARHGYATSQQQDPPESGDCG